MHLRRSILMVSMLCSMLTNSGEHLFTPSKYLEYFLCKSEMNDMKVRVCRCTVWKAHQGIFNGKVGHLCPETKKLCCGDKRNSCHCECAVHECAEKHAFGEVFICNSHQDREVLVHHHAFGLPKPPRVSSPLACLPSC